MQVIFTVKLFISIISIHLKLGLLKQYKSKICLTGIIQIPPEGHYIFIQIDDINKVALQSN